MTFTLGPPTQSGFTTFLRDVMGIPSTVIPDNSMSITIAYGVAIDTVNNDLALAAPNEYTLAVYNLAGDRVVNFAPDPSPPVPFPGKFDDAGNPIPFMAYLRQQYHLAEFTPGVVASTSDEGTSGSLLNPEFMQTLSMTDMQLIKTPWGRNYLSYAQKAGYGPWGLT